MAVAANELFEHLEKLGVEASCGIGVSPAGNGKVIAVRFADEKHRKLIPETWNGFPVGAECVGVLRAF